MKDRDIASLVDGCLEGDENAWAELVSRYQPVVKIICRRYGLSRDESDDIFCEVNWKIFKNLSRLRSKESFIGFVYSTARNEILHLRRADQTHRIIEEKMKELQVPNKGTNAEEKMLKEEREILVGMALQQIPERCLKLINLIFNNENEPSLAEAAKLLMRKESAVRESLQRCYRKVKEILKKISGDENLLC
jgi:RNA polymerase sigma factor (sigma-70 family)